MGRSGQEYLSARSFCAISRGKQDRSEIHHIDVAPAEISEIVPVRLLLDVAEQSSGTMVRNLWLKLSIEVARMQPEVLQPVTMTVSTRSFTK